MSKILMHLYALYKYNINFIFFLKIESLIPITLHIIIITRYFYN